MEETPVGVGGRAAGARARTMARLGARVRRVAEGGDGTLSGAREEMATAVGGRLLEGPDE